MKWLINLTLELLLLLFLMKNVKSFILSKRSSSLHTNNCLRMSSEASARTDKSFILSKRRSSLHTNTCLRMTSEASAKRTDFVVNSMNITEALMEKPDMPETFDKYMTILGKSVIVMIRYSAESGLHPFYLTAVNKIKSSHSDVLIERKILPRVTEGEEPTFEIRVDGKLVVGKSNMRVIKHGPDKVIKDSTGGMSVYISMAEMETAIYKARRRRRPETMYGKRDNKKGAGLDILRGQNPTKEIKKRMTV